MQHRTIELWSIPWRRALAIFAGVGVAGFAIAAFLAPAPWQTWAARFAIPAYSYTCLGLAAIALTELRERPASRIFMAIVIAALAPLSLLGYAAGSVPPLLILGVHFGFLVAWIALPRRAIWTLAWLLEALAWIFLALAQGRLL